MSANVPRHQTSTNHCTRFHDYQASQADKRDRDGDADENTVSEIQGRMPRSDRASTKGLPGGRVGGNESSIRDRF